jgi:hypothetical protein
MISKRTSPVFRLRIVKRRKSMMILLSSIPPTGLALFAVLRILTILLFALSADHLLL